MNENNGNNNTFFNNSNNQGNNFNGNYFNPNSNLNNNFNGNYVNPNVNPNSNYVNPNVNPNNNFNGNYINPNNNGNYANFNNNNNNLDNYMPGNNFANVNQLNNNSNNKNKYLKYAVIVVGVIVAIVGIYFIFTNVIGVGGGHKNTTGLSSYTDSDVGLNCHQTFNNSDNNTDIYMDYIFNKDNHTTVYMKTIKNYPNGLTDEKYAEFIKTFDSYDELKCSSYDEECLKNHHEFPSSGTGFDIVIDRKGNTIEMTNNMITGYGEKVTNKDIRSIKDELKEQGYTCK